MPGWEAHAPQTHGHASLTRHIFTRQHLVMSTYASLNQHTLHMFLLVSCQAHQAHSSSRSLPCACPPMSIWHTAPHRSRGGTAENANLLQERVAGRFSKSARGCTRLPHQAEAELRKQSYAGTGGRPVGMCSCGCPSCSPSCSWRAAFSWQRSDSTSACSFSFSAASNALSCSSEAMRAACSSCMQIATP